jgi:hypothetical protein
MEKELSLEPIEVFEIKDKAGAVLKINYFIEKDIVLDVKWNKNQLHGIVVNLQEDQTERLYQFLKKYYEKM